MSDDPATALIAALLNHPDPQPLSGGRVNRVWRAGDRVAKLYARDGATPLFDNRPEDEWRVLHHLRGQGIAPAPLSRHETVLGTVIISRHLTADRAGAGGHAVAALLSRLWAASAPEGLPLGPIGADVLDHGAGMLHPGDPLHALRPEPPAPTAPVLIHGDPVLGNLIATATGPRLIDFQCAARGDPLTDIAHHLSPAMAHLYGPPDRDGFRAALPDALERRYRRDGPAFHWRIACYCQWRIDHGDAAYGPALAAELAGLSSFARAE